MTIIAFDVSKRELVGVRADQHGTKRERFVIQNEPPAIDRFLAPMIERYPKVLIGSEATAEYHRPLAEWCVAHDVKFKLLNPILTKQFTRATIRKRKTDQTDAEIIARLLSQGEGTLLTMESLTAGKSLNRTASALKTLSQTVQAIERHVRQIGVNDAATLALLQAPHQALERAVAGLRAQVRMGVDAKLEKLLRTIPGIGETIAPTLLVEIGDINRFPSGKTLVAYAGLDPKVKQSGTSLKHNTKITKRGSPYLRQAACIAAYIAARHDPELKMYWQKKIKEGKRYKEAMVATARKILYRVYAVLKRQTPYVERCPQPAA